MTTPAAAATAAAPNVSRGTRSAPAAAPTTKVKRSNYQPIVLAEFIACILLTAMTPIATKKSADGLSPYAGKDMVKLGAITVLFLILGFMSSTGRTSGRLAAWFGGLILITDGMLEAANIAKDLALFTGGTGTTSTGATGTTQAPGTTTAGGRG